MIKSRHQARVERLMLAFEQRVHAKPTIPDEATRILRARLILEECLETVEALGVRVTETKRGSIVEFENLIFEPYGEPDLVEIADGCADISVVTIGTLSACGISDLPLLEEVDRNNLLKIEYGRVNRETGKFEKPKNHPAPAIGLVLEAQCWDRH